MKFVLSYSDQRMNEERPQEFSAPSSSTNAFNFPEVVKEKPEANPPQYQTNQDSKEDPAIPDAGHSEKGPRVLVNVPL